MKHTENLRKYKIAEEDMPLMQKLINKNAQKYISKFKILEEKKLPISWHWGAFLGGNYWYIYRKIRVFSFMALFLDILMILIMKPIIHKLMSELFATNALLRSESLLNFGAFNQNDIFNVITLVVCFLILSLIPRIFYSLIANNIYRQQCNFNLSVSMLEIDEIKSKRNFKFLVGTSIKNVILAFSIKIVVIIYILATFSK